MENVVHVSDAAKRLGVTAQHLRVLERHERIPAARRDSFGDRIYSEFDLALLKSLGVGSRPRRLRHPEEVLEAAR